MESRTGRSVTDEEPFRESKKNDLKKAVKGFKMVSFFLPKMRKFLETKTMIGRTKNLNLKARNFINDFTDFDRGESKKKVLISIIWNEFLSIIEAICSALRLNRIPLFDPENNLKLCFNTLIVCYNLFYLFIISVEVFFEAHFK